MAAIFRYLHDNGVSREQMLNCMKEINFVEGKVRRKVISFGVFCPEQRMRISKRVLEFGNSPVVNHLLFQA